MEIRDFHVAKFQVISLKKQIEEIKGRDAFPYEQQLIIHQGKVLQDETTLEANNVKENSFVVVMVNKVSNPLKSDLRSLSPLP